jgi:phospholipid transport system substrate-binding protein
MNKLIQFTKAILLSATIASSVLGVSQSAFAASTLLETELETKQPHLIVQHASEATFARILEVKQREKGSSQAYNKIMEEELLPIVSYQFAAYKVLGSHARSMSKAELNEFVEVFREYLMSNYANLMAEYDGQTVEFFPVEVTSKTKEVAVRGVLNNDNGPSTNLLFKMRKMRSGDWKVYDILAEGISMLDAKRTEFSPIIRTQGTAALIEQLKNQTNVLTASL